MVIDITGKIILYPKDDNGREIWFAKLNNVQPIGKSYPDIKLFAHDERVTHNPIREQIMSLSRAMIETSHASIKPIRAKETCPVFFFGYNLSNYYHFLWDSLPYLITYKHLKDSMPELKLLVSAAKPHKFVTEFLELLGIIQDDLLVIKDDTLYEEMYVSNSYTHDGLSNLPPRQEVYDLYRMLADKIEPDPSLPCKIYISRRSHKHGQYDNMGTDYTARRRLVNEDDLVDYLASKGYVEIFTELLSTKEKIALFKEATHVVGPIGGGLCNVLFCGPQTKLISIVSPYFMQINERFKYSFANVNVDYFNETSNIELGPFKKYMRVRVKKTGLIGEISTVTSDSLCVIYSKEAVAGWNAQESYEQLWVSPNEVEALDPGLNSAWKMDLDKFKVFINE